jgi:hypothetical protein
VPLNVTTVWSPVGKKSGLAGVWKNKPSVMLPVNVPSSVTVPDNGMDDAHSPTEIEMMAVASCANVLRAVTAAASATTRTTLKNARRHTVCGLESDPRSHGIALNSDQSVAQNVLTTRAMPGRRSPTPAQGWPDLRWYEPR